MEKNLFAKKRCVITLSGEALEKISVFSKGNLSQYARDAILEKIQRDTMNYVNLHNNEIAMQITRIATALENLNIAMQNMSIINSNALTPIIPGPQATALAVNNDAEQKQLDADEQARLADAEHERLFEEALMKSALDIIDNGWCGKGNG